MPISRDLSGVPEVPQAEGVGQSPEADRYILPLLEAWFEEYQAADDFNLSFAVPGTRFRASWAGGCARQLGYKVIEHDADMARCGPPGNSPEVIDRALAIVDAYAPTDPPSMADFWRMDSGTEVHLRLQALAMKLWPGCVVEQKVDLRPDVDGSASVDILIVEPAGLMGVQRTLIEIKTKGGFAFKKAVIPFKGKAEGPNLAAKLQAGLAARALGADQVIILFVSQENISVGVAEKNGLKDHERFIGRWMYTLEDLGPILDRETARIRRVLQMVDNGELPPRAIYDEETPADARIVDPSKGSWTVVDGEGRITNAGRYYLCDGYCSWQTRCIADGPDATIPHELRLADPVRRQDPGVR